MREIHLLAEGTYVKDLPTPSFCGQVVNKPFKDCVSVVTFYHWGEDAAEVAADLLDPDERFCPCCVALAAAIKEAS